MLKHRTIFAALAAVISVLVTALPASAGIGTNGVDMSVSHRTVQVSLDSSVTVSVVLRNIESTERRVKVFAADAANTNDSWSIGAPSDGKYVGFASVDLTLAPGESRSFDARISGASLPRRTDPVHQAFVLQAGTSGLVKRAAQLFTIHPVLPPGTVEEPAAPSVEEAAPTVTAPTVTAPTVTAPTGKSSAPVTATLPPVPAPAAKAPVSAPVAQSPEAVAPAKARAVSVPPTVPANASGGSSSKVPAPAVTEALSPESGVAGARTGSAAPGTAPEAAPVHTAEAEDVSVSAPAAGESEGVVLSASETPVDVAPSRSLLVLVALVMVSASAVLWTRTVRHSRDV